MKAADPYLSMLRSALLPTLAVGLASVAVSLAFGVNAVIGSALGATVVIVFFAATLLVMRAARRVAPEMLLGVAMAVYSTKIAVIGGLVFWLSGETWLSPAAFTITALAGIVVWLAGQVRGFTLARIPVFEAGVQ